MVTKYFNASVAGSGVQFTLDSSDSLIIGQDGFVVSTATYAIDGRDQTSVMVRGTVAAETVGIILGDTEASTSVVRATVDVGGTVWSAINGVSLIGQEGRLVNHGTISAGQHALTFNGVGTGTTLVKNDGIVEGGTYGIYHTGSSNLALVNSGTIRGDSFALFQWSYSVGKNLITNSGLIEGSLRCGSGNDSYTSTGAGSLVGVFEGNDGNDSFRSGNAAETFDGGAGVDTANYSAMAGVVVVLDGVTEGENGANGDVLIGVEDVIGSRLGADRIYGSAANNMLSGRGGTDWLVGNSGADTLVGGTGSDTLYGGTGDDRFVFNSPSEASDVIGDFNSAATGNNDHFAIKALSFGGGLTVGALAAASFWTSTTNAAHDATDRFIFRTSDTTLWFDANGNQAGGPTLVADLQAWAVMTFQDIVII